MTAGVDDAFAGGPRWGGSVAARKMIMPTKKLDSARFRIISWGQAGKPSTSRST